MKPENQRIGSLSQISSRLSNHLWVASELASTPIPSEEKAADLEESITDILAILTEAETQGLKLETYYWHSRNKKTPLTLAMEVYAHTEDERIFNAMMTYKNFPPRVNNRQQDYEYAFTRLVINIARQPEKLDRFLTFIENQHGGKKLLERCWPGIASGITSECGDIYLLEVVHSFEKHGYNLDAPSTGNAKQSLLRTFDRIAYYYERQPENEFLVRARPLYDALRARYQPTSSAPMPPANAPSPQGVSKEGAQLISPDKSKGEGRG